ncbi:hypothetical protein [Caulobacter sp. CCG-8]|uniref:hypothetical protein n=1 Tax=Caulobacter sp. CCG-8 TaxID=3127958 RepID=UPI00307F33AC
MSLLNGTAPPAPGDGVDGDFWIDTTAWFIYGPKAAGAWPAGVAMIGHTPTNAELEALITPIVDSAVTAAVNALYLQLTVEMPDLSLSGDAISPTAPAGTVVGTLVGKTPGSLLSISPNDGRFILTGDDYNGWKVVRGSAPVVAGDLDLLVTQTYLAGRNSPKVDALRIFITDPLPVLTTAGYAFAASRFVFPVTSTGGAGAGNRFQLSNTYFATPAWTATGWRFAFANFYLAGAVGPERPANTAMTIEFATVTDDPVGTNAWPVTFNGGSTSVVIPAGQVVLSDEVVGFAPAANSHAYIRVQKSVPVGGYQLVSIYPSTVGSDLGEGNEGTSAVQTGKRLGGAIAVTNPGSTQSYSPCFAVAKGWDGTSPVFLINGTSRQVPTSDLVYRQAQRSVTSAIMRGLDDTTGGRMAFGNFSQSGAYALNTASEATGAFAARMAALRAIGNAPFNRIATDIGPNDINQGLLSLPAIKKATTNWWRFWRAHCPSTPVFHFFGEPWTTSAPGTYWTTVADQTPLPSAAYPDGVQPLWFNWLLTSADRPAWVTAIDMRTTYEDGASPGKWKAPGVTGALLANVSAGALYCSVDMSAVAELGESLVVDNERIYVSSTTGPASNQTLGMHSKFTAAHPATTLVRTAYTTDGVHPAAPLMIAGGGYIAGLKVSGVIH